jgi:HSP20 family molecular chaperone IbpA
MKKKLSIPKEILMNVDFLNTIHGGMSEPSVEINSREDSYEVTVKAPGIGPDDLEIEIRKDKLLIYHLLPLFAKTVDENEKDLHSIRFISKMVIPSDVDIDGITARYDESNKSLMLYLPYNDVHDILRKVEIERW